jgi:hypothetical protein
MQDVVSMRTRMRIGFSDHTNVILSDIVIVRMVLVAVVVVVVVVFIQQSLLDDLRHILSGSGQDQWGEDVVYDHHFVLLQFSNMRRGEDGGRQAVSAFQRCLGIRQFRSSIGFRQIPGKDQRHGTRCQLVQADALQQTTCSSGRKRRSHIVACLLADC